MPLHTFLFLLLATVNVYVFVIFGIVSWRRGGVPRLDGLEWWEYALLAILFFSWCGMAALMR